MLNLSDNRIHEKDYEKDYACLQQVRDEARPVKRLQTLTIIMLVIVASLFLPWTQNVRVNGKLTTLYPEQRPQTVQNRIPGRIAAWFVREGDFVKKGDTILQISEVDDRFFDPQIIERTERQLQAKSGASENFLEKSQALEDQIEALKRNRQNKMEQARNKLVQSRLQLTSDSIDVVAAQIDYNIAGQRQLVSQRPPDWMLISCVLPSEQKCTKFW